MCSMAPAWRGTNDALTLSPKSKAAELSSSRLGETPIGHLANIEGKAKNYFFAAFFFLDFFFMAMVMIPL